MSKQHRVLVVDDHGVVRHGLKALLEGHEGIQVVGEASSAAEALQRVAELRPDVVVMDVRLPGEDGITACARIRERFPATEVVMLSSFGEKEAVTGAVLAGAKGYILKNLAYNHLVEAILHVAGGGWFLDPTLAQSVMESVRALAAGQPLAGGKVAGVAGAGEGGRLGSKADGKGGFEDPLAILTPSEIQILRLIAAGKTNREIGQELFISEKTARNHVSQLLSKLGCRNRVEAAAFAVKHGLGDQ